VSKTNTTTERWGHLALLGIFVLATVAFLYDTLSKSFRLENVIVILPVSALLLLLCAVQVYRAFSLERHEKQDASGSTVEVQSDDEQTSTSRWAAYRVAWFMLLLGAYILGLAFVAFDLSTALFIFLALIIQGERRLWFGAMYAIVLAVALTWGLTHMVPFPFPSLLF